VQCPFETVQCGLDCDAKERWTAIMQMLGQRGVVAGGTLIEQPAQIRFGHGGRLFGSPKLRQLQARAMIVVRIGAARIVERSHGASAIGKPIADRTKREPCRGEIRRCLDCLRQDIRRSDEVAARPKFNGRLVAAIATRSPEETNNGPVSLMKTPVKRSRRDRS
jgi:hypothetical protein